MVGNLWLAGPESGYPYLNVGNGAWSRYVMGVDDTHAYIASGMIPAWYFGAVNLATGGQKVLLESPTERVMDIIERFPSAYARVPQGGGASDKEYWLYHGQAIPMTNSTPPWPKRTSPWDKAVPKPEVYFDQKMDGFWKPLSGYAVQWIAPALDGRLIVISMILAADELNNHRAPEEAKLFVHVHAPTDDAFDDVRH